MSYSAMIKFAPIHTLERHADPDWNRPGRSLYTTGALRFAPGVTEVPLLVDHDDNHRIGTVHEIVRMAWTDGPWLVARATVDETPPSWMRTYATKASFGSSTYSRGTFTDGEMVAAALVSEVSVLSPDKEPAEPRAELILLKRETAPTSRAVGSYELKPGETIFDCPPGAMLRRPNIGHVTGIS